MTQPRIDTTRLQKMSRAYTETATLWAAIDLGLFTAVANGASDEASVAEALGSAFSTPSDWWCLA
jgi:hypothetical protein